MTKAKLGKSNIYVGVDVGKWILDAWIYEKALHIQVENSPAGIRRC